MKNYSIHVGIDISKLKLDINILQANDLKGKEHVVIENNKESIMKFISSLKKILPLEEILFCCENTGIYTYPLSNCCLEKGVDCWIADALEIKRSIGIRRGKDDKTDAKDIALYSFRNLDKIQLSSHIPKANQEIKLLYSEREKVMKAITQLKMTAENQDFIDQKIYAFTKKINQKTIKFLNGVLESIEGRIEEIIKNNKQLNEQFELVKSVPGVGKQIAIYFIIATKGFTCFKNARKFACYAGVAPFEHSSGSSIRGKTKVHPIADKKIKSLLHMATMVAIRYDPQLKEYYDNKKEKGKPSLLVMNNIKNKIISRVFAVINRQTPYVNTYKFSA